MVGKEARSAPKRSSDGNVSCLGKLEIADADMRLLSINVLVERLVASGVSRLTAERFVAIERGNAEPGRARRHPVSRH